MKKNLIMNSDSYKASHWLQYPPNTTYTFSYLESRGSQREYKESVFFGLQYILKEYLSKPITMEDVEKAKKKIETHGLPFNYEGWKLLVERHKGYFPLKIRAVPEGTVVPTRNVLMTVENTDPDFYWLTSYVETLLERVWYPMTVATQSYYLKKLIYKFLTVTADNPDTEILFKLHDFGSRGVSSQESAMIGGASHLVNFMGSDTLDTLDFIEEYYGEYCAGFSIPAGEHSTFSSWGRDRETEAYRNMLKAFAKPNSLLAVVSDTWNIFNACENIWGEDLKQEVINSGATVVIRPDSGDPETVVMRCLDILGKKFGFTHNTKGYKVLNNVKLIQGDGVNPDSIHAILNAMTSNNWSTTNIAFGMGGALLQKVDRDTLKVAYKCSYTVNDRGGVDVYKDPITDKGKKSKKGRLDLVERHGKLETVKLKDTEARAFDSVLQTVYLNGAVNTDTTFEDVRKRAKLS